MLKNLRYLNKLQIISNVVLFPLCIITIVTKNQKIIALFWIFLLLALIGNVLFEGKWSKDGKTWFKNLDKDYKKNLTRKSNNILDICFMIYIVLFFVFYVFIEYFPNLVAPFISTSVFYIINVIYEVVSLIIVVRTANEIDKLIKTKNDRMTRKKG